MESQCTCSNGIDIDEMPREINPECIKHAGISNQMIKRSDIQPTLNARVKWQLRALEAELESYQLVTSCAKDVLNYWPQFSFRTIKIMVGKMDSLKQALDMLK